MFMIHGLMSLLVAIASFFILAPSPSQTKKSWHKQGYYTDKDVKVVVNRIIRDDPTKATMHNRQALSFGLLWKSTKDYHLWPLYFVGLTFGLPGQYRSMQMGHASDGQKLTRFDLQPIPSVTISSSPCVCLASALLAGMLLSYLL